MAAVVIADTSPLIALARVDGLGWLQERFSEVLVPDVVQGNTAGLLDTADIPGAPARKGVA